MSKAVAAVRHPDLSVVWSWLYDQMVSMVAGLGGFQNRKRDGFPRSQTIRIGLQRAANFVLALEARWAVGSETYG